MNFKKVFICLLCVLITLISASVFANDEIDQIWVEETALTAAEAEKLEIFSKAAVVYMNAFSNDGGDRDFSAEAMM